MLKLTLMKNRNINRLQVGFETSPVVSRAIEVSALSRSAPKEFHQKVAAILDDVSTMLLKLPSSTMVKTVQSIFNSGHVNVSFRLDKNTSPDRVPRINSSIMFSNSKPTYISIDANTVGVGDLNDSNFIDNLDAKKAVQTLYHGLIRESILQAGEASSFSSPKNKLVGLVTSYYIRLFKHILDLSTLNIRQIMKLEYTINRFLHVVSFKSNVRMANQYAKDYINSNHKSDATSEDFDNVFSELDDNEELFKSIESFKDIFKIFNSLAVSFDPESTQITKSFSSIGVQNYLAMISSLDFIIASIIMSKYTKIYAKLKLDDTVIKSIEVEVNKLIKKIKYGSAANVTQV